MVKARNQVVTLVIEAVSEAPVLGSKAGVKTEKATEVLSGSLAARKVLAVKGEKPLSHELAPGGKVEHHRKDLGIVLAAGRKHRAALSTMADRGPNVRNSHGQGEG